jgi:transcriptional regulator with XRE-family HTH domain
LTQTVHREPATPPIRISLARFCRDSRTALGRSKAELAASIGVSATYVDQIERGRANPTVDVVDRLITALGLQLMFRPPIVIGDERQRDLVHARCSGYVSRRLQALGWQTAREVEITHSRSHGWIDLLAYDVRSRTLLVIEIKTMLDDVGATERQIGWYEREARAIARQRGWAPRRVVTWLLILATDEVDARLRANRLLIDQVFPVRATDMTNRLLDADGPWADGRGLALIDPSSRRRDWLIRCRIDGRRSSAPYRDYRDAAIHLGSR